MLIRLRGHKLTLATAITWIIGLAFTVLWAVPIFWMFSTSLKPPGEIVKLEVEWLPQTVTLENYQRVFLEPVARWFFNSTVVTIISTIGNVTFGALTGYALARMHFPGRNMIFWLMLAVLMIPSEISIVPLFLGALKLHLSDTYAGLILPSMASVFSAYLFRQFFLSFPRELEDAVFIDGGTRWTIFRRVAFPLARPATIAACILMFASNWNSFLWPLLIIFNREMKTLPLGLAYFSPASGQATAERFNYGTGLAAAAILAIPTLIVFLILQRYFIEGVSTVGLKG